jgi:hypothetical protein
MFSRIEAVKGGDWPRTTRILPWFIAAFVAMIYLLPFDAMTLPLSLPVDSKPDRIVLPLLVLVWAFAALSTRSMTREFRVTGFALVTFVFVCIAFASVLLNVRTLSLHGEFDLGIKKLALLVSYTMFFVVAVTTIRPTEVRSFGRFMVGLGVLTAIGTIYEFRTHVNVFYDWTAKLFTFISVTPAPQGDVSNPYERLPIVGPTAHGLADTTILAFALPWAVIELYNAETPRQRFVWGLATGLLLAGGFATVRKTSAVVPLVILLVLFLYSRKKMLKILPIGLLIIVFIQVIAPGALVKVKSQLQPSRVNNNSTQGRTADYAATRPEILRHLATGRGFGTYNPERYRFLDNEYLKRMIETGLLGAAAYILMTLAGPMLAHSVIRGGNPTRAGPALAASASALTYFVSGFLYDVFFFPQAPYLFFLSTAFIVVLATAERDARRGRRLERASPPAAPRPQGARSAATHA